MTLETKSANHENLVETSIATSSLSTWKGFDGKLWQVHKFGGTSVATGECFRQVAQIIENQLPTIEDVGISYEGPYLGIVVSAMGGKPKVTDLLLDSVKAAARRDSDTVEALLSVVVRKHESCLQDLFGNGTPEHQQKNERLLSLIRQDILDIKDILKTVSLMKWEATRISELVSGYGELWSAQILASLLQDRELAKESEFYRDEFVFVDARRVITIDEEKTQSGAVCWDVSKSKLDEVYQTELQKLNTSGDQIVRMHFVFTGYVASNTDGVATTLKRDGSDYSAAIIGRLLHSSQITVWTDVDGVLSADPRKVPGAHVLHEVSYKEAMELAYFGAKVIHPKTMQPAICTDLITAYNSAPCYQIPIVIRNTFRPEVQGTRIYTTATSLSSPDECVCGFSTIDDIALINVEGSGLLGVPGIARRLFGTLEQHGVNVILISQASSEHSITFATTTKAMDKNSTNQALVAQEVLREEFRRELESQQVSSIGIFPPIPCSIVAAVGDGMADMTGVSGRFFSALGDAKINVLAISQGCSERNISAVIASSESTRAIRALHAAFRLSHTTVRIGVVIGGGMVSDKVRSGTKFSTNELGVSLMKLLDFQRSKLRHTFEIDLQVCAVVSDDDDEDTVTNNGNYAPGSIICLKNDDGDSSINMHAYNKAIDMKDNKAASVGAALESSAISFGGECSSDSSSGNVEDGDFAVVLEPKFGGTEENEVKGFPLFLKKLIREECAHHVIFDCTNSEKVSSYHAKWISSGVHVITANNTGLSGPKEQRDAISAAEAEGGGRGAQYLREVTVGGGLPVVTTLRTLLHSGDRIRFIDGIFSVSMSFIMYRISPPPLPSPKSSSKNGSTGLSKPQSSSQFDLEMTHGAFKGDLLSPSAPGFPLPPATSASSSSLGKPCRLSQAIKEAVALGLMEEDLSRDLENEYTARVLMVLAQELGFDQDMSTADIQSKSDKILDELMKSETAGTSQAGGGVDQYYRLLSSCVSGGQGGSGDAESLIDSFDRRVEARVQAAASRGRVLRHIASVDVKSQSVAIEIMEVPNNHVFAMTPPSCECVRLFTHRYQPYPLVIQGPAAGADSTSSALLAELLQLMRTKIGPKKGVLKRKNSHAYLS